MFRPSRFRKDARGTITLLAAFLLPVLIGFLALAAEFGYGLLMQVENQRVADAAALAAAIAYGNGQTTNYATAATNIANLNGMTGATLATTLTTVPQDSSRQAIKVVLTRTEVLGLAKAISSIASMPISATAYAQIGQGPSSGCIMALGSAGQGITVASGSTVTATSCNVISRANITCSGSATITASSKIYVGSNNCGTGTRTSSVSDPLSSNAGVLAATAELVTLSSLTAPSAPTVLGTTALNFAGTQNNATLTNLQNLGCTATFSAASGPQYTVSCPAGTYAFGNISVTGAKLTWTFAGASTVNVNGAIAIDSQSSVVTLPGATWNVNSGISNAGSNTTFGAGNYNLGSTTGAFSPCTSSYSICNNGTTALLSFTGPSIFNLSAAIRNNGKTELGLIGSSQTNSFKVGNGSDGAAISLTAGTVTLGDAGTFQVLGDIVQSAQSCVRLGSAATHSIAGNISINGSMQMFAGTYAVKGYLAAPSGSITSCNGTTPSSFFTTTNATIVIGGATTTAACTSGIFCMLENAPISLTAPSSGTYQNLAVIVPNSTSGSATLSTGGSTATITGAIYAPGLSFTAQGSVNITAGTCFDLIAKEVQVGGSAKLSAVECFPSSSNSSTTSAAKIVN